MTDGPFKNLRLRSLSKRFAEAVQNEAEDPKNCISLASHAIVNDICRTCSELISALNKYFYNDQLDLDPMNSIRSIFEEQNKSSFTDHLIRDIEVNIYQRDLPLLAFEKGLKTSLSTHIDEFRNRIHEAGIEAHRNGPMYKDQFDRLIRGTNQALKNLDRNRMLDAIKDGRKNEFKLDIEKKAGLDEGPEL